MKKRFFVKIIVVYISTAVICLLFAESYLARVVRSNHIQNLKGHLTSQANVIAGNIRFNANARLDDLCRKLKTQTGARITIVREDGSVMGDSDEDSSIMDNHGGRLEIRQARVQGVGTSLRYSRTVDYEMLYVAHRLKDEKGFNGFLRLAVPLKDIDKEVDLLRHPMRITVFLILLIPAAVSLWQTARLRRLVGQVTEVSTSLARGDLKKRLILEGAGEFDRIAENLNEMATNLKESLIRNETEKERLGTILRSIPDALIIIDPDDRILLASSAASDFFDTSLVGRPLVEVIRDRSFLKLMDEVKSTSYQEERELYLDIHGERHVTVKASPFIHHPGLPPGFVILFHDITRLKRLENMRRDFVANVSHEIKTPITAIKGFADTLAEGAIEEPENARKFVEIIRSNSRRMNELVDDLMTISRLEMGAITVDKKDVDLEKTIREVYGNFAVAAEEKGISLNVDIAPGLSTISADRNMVNQILTNLVSNAVKFTNQGAVTTGTGTAETGGNAEGGFLYVRDTGIGIPAKHLPRLGERFYRVDPSRSRSQGGTGLGLAIVKHLAQVLGWTLKIESGEGAGTTVKVFFRDHA